MNRPGRLQRIYFQMKGQIDRQQMCCSALLMSYSQTFCLPDDYSLRIAERVSYSQLNKITYAKRVLLLDYIFKNSNINQCHAS